MAHVLGEMEEVNERFYCTTRSGAQFKLTNYLLLEFFHLLFSDLGRRPETAETKAKIREGKCNQI
jgi:hypothetical protein